MNLLRVIYRPVPIILFIRRDKIEWESSLLKKSRLRIQLLPVEVTGRNRFLKFPFALLHIPTEFMRGVPTAVVDPLDSLDSQNIGLSRCRYTCSVCPAGLLGGGGDRLFKQRLPGWWNNVCARQSDSPPAPRVILFAILLVWSLIVPTRNNITVGHNTEFTAIRNDFCLPD